MHFQQIAQLQAWWNEIGRTDIRNAHKLFKVARNMSEKYWNSLKWFGIF